MANVVTRGGKGSRLTHQEGDANINNINNELISTGAIVAAINSALSSSLVSGEWKKVASLIRLRLTGTGACVVDSKNALDVESTDLFTYTVSSATNQIEYPYLGDDATHIRVTLTGDCTAEVL